MINRKLGKLPPVVDLYFTGNVTKDGKEIIPANSIVPAYVVTKIVEDKELSFYHIFVNDEEFELNSADEKVVGITQMMVNTKPSSYIYCYNKLLGMDIEDIIDISMNKLIGSGNDMVDMVNLLNHIKSINNNFDAIIDNVFMAENAFVQEIKKKNAIIAKYEEKFGKIEDDTVEDVTEEEQVDNKEENVEEDNNGSEQ